MILGKQILEIFHHSGDSIFIDLRPVHGEVMRRYGLNDHDADRLIKRLSATVQNAMSQNGSLILNVK